MKPREERADVVIVGGGPAGSSAAILLRRRRPSARVVVVEKSPAFDRKVGESTVEISGFFFSRVLKLLDHLSREQLTKQGFRYWWTGPGIAGVRQSSEVGPRQLARVASFQLDRSTFDEELLSIARAEGAEVWRPAVVSAFDVPETGADNTLEIQRSDGETVRLSARWIIDASGRATLLARRLGLKRENLEHPTSAIWARLRGVRDLDGAALSGADPDDPWFRSVPASRRLATNHVLGFGHWWWLIPLRSGETSVGIVWDRRFFQPPAGDLEDRWRQLVAGNPLVAQLLDGAELVPGDLRTLGHLPYFVERCCGRGWAAVGDAAGFIDPFYSPGLDHVAFSVTDRVALVERDLATGGIPQEAIDASNRTFRQFFRYFFDGIYKDKYAVMGDYDLMTASFLLDTAGYYFVSVWPAYKKSAGTLRLPPFGAAGARPAFAFIRFYNQRLARLALRRRARGVYGRRNAGRRPVLVGFSLGPSNVVMYARGLAYWLRAEAEDALAALRAALARHLREAAVAFARPPRLALRDMLLGNFEPLPARPRRSRMARRPA